MIAAISAPARTKEKPVLSVPELEAIARGRDGNDLLARNLAMLPDTASLLLVLGRYIRFNSVFAGGVAILAGAVAARQDLFRDPQEDCEALADTSGEIGAAIFAAAVDEFDIWSTPARGTHRMLAKFLLKSAGDYFGHAQFLAPILRPDAFTDDVLGHIQDSYMVARIDSDEKLFRAVGFHLGSEMLADREFCIWDGYLRERQADFVAAMERLPLPHGKGPFGAYTWIMLHTKVEKDHFEFGLRGANEALRCYAGRESGEQVKQWMMDGFLSFAEVQSSFMEKLHAKIIK